MPEDPERDHGPALRGRQALAVLGEDRHQRRGFAFDPNPVGVVRERHALDPQRLADELEAPPRLDVGAPD